MPSIETQNCSIFREIMTLQKNSTQQKRYHRQQWRAVRRRVALRAPTAHYSTKSIYLDNMLLCLITKGKYRELFTGRPSCASIAFTDATRSRSRSKPCEKEIIVKMYFHRLFAEETLKNWNNYIFCIYPKSHNAVASLQKKKRSDKNFNFETKWLPSIQSTTKERYLFS